MLTKTEKRRGSEIRVERSTYQGRKFINLREYYLPSGGNPDNPEDYRPTKNGFTLPFSAFNEFKRALSKVPDQE